MENWVLMKKGAEFDEISRKFLISRRLACLIRNRDIIGEKAIYNYLHGNITDLYDGMLMKDMDKAVDILMEKIQQGEQIRIIGDYDIDGVNATYILLEGIKKLGGNVDMDIPDRITDGYGLNKNLIDRAFEDGTDTIITCDNGIAAAQEIAYGKSLGMTIIVTDHHEVPFDEEKGQKVQQLPPADAVVNPKRLDCDYPFKGLCGAAVAYKLIEALLEALGEGADTADYLIEHVALATVGDVMDLVDENRIFVKQGLEMMRRTSNLGLRSLIECTGIDPMKLSSYHIGFVLGPCLNAGGRLDTAKRAIQLFTADTKKDADILAGDLKALNDSRKEMTVKAVEAAKKYIDETGAGEDKVLVIYLPECHESLAGIVAGRIRESYYRPVFVLTDAEEGIKGSGRSIEAYHMYEELSRCKDILLKFGGHKLAAGLSMKKEQIESFRRRMNEGCRLGETDFFEKVCIDMQLPFSLIRKEFVEELKLLEPYGKGNTKPVFAEKDVEILNLRTIGKNQDMLKLKVKDLEGTEVEALYFGEKDKFLDYLSEIYGRERVMELSGGKGSKIKVALTFYPDINEFMGKSTPQIVVTHYK